MQGSSLDPRFLNQLVHLVEQRIRYKDEQLDTDFLIDALKEVFPENHADVEVAVQSLFGKGIFIARTPANIVAQAAAVARLYLSQSRERWFIYPATFNSASRNFQYENSIKHKYKVFRKSNNIIDAECEEKQGFVVYLKPFLQAYQLVLEVEGNTLERRIRDSKRRQIDSERRQIERGNLSLEEKKLENFIQDKRNEIREINEERNRRRRMRISGKEWHLSDDFSDLDSKEQELKERIRKLELKMRDLNLRKTKLYSLGEVAQDEPLLIIKVFHFDGQEIAKHIAEVLWERWPSCKFEIQVSF